MIVDQTRSLQAVLAGAVAANQPEVRVRYTEWNREGEKTLSAEFEVAMNSATDVVILASPVANLTREVEEITIYNKDTASVTVTVKSDSAAGGGTEYIAIKATVPTLKTLGWTLNTGWYLTTA